MPDAELPQKARFRTACDSCTASKIRCDKGHPVCNRCVLSGLQCSYSESRKHGRQPWRKRLANKGQSATAHIIPSGQPLIAADVTIPHIVLPGQSGWGNLLASPSAPLARDHNWDPLIDFGQDGPTTLLPSWASGDGFGAEIDIGDFSIRGEADLPPISSPGMNTGRHDTALRASENLGEPAPISNTKSTHDCEAQAISILSSLQHGEMRQGLMSCSTDPAHVYADLELAPTFDRVLAVNKAALNGWSKLMKCSCAQCPHLILLYVSILSKMLFWYRIATREKIAPSGGAESDGITSINGSNTVGYTPQEAPTSDRFSVRPTTIQAGALDLDAEEQADLRRTLLLRELNRMENAIYELMNADRKEFEDNADESIRRTVKWSLAGIPQLNEELQDIIQKVKQINGVDGVGVEMVSQ